MLRAVLLLQLLAWVSLTSAFFIWEACRADGTCRTSSKRELEKRRSPNGEDDSQSLTLDIVQRSQPNYASHTSRVSRDLQQLHRKYARSQRSKTSDAERPLSKRANEYSIVGASPPAQGNSVGVEQDGTDFAYFVKAKVGSKDRPLYMLLDTGASATWVMGSKCTTEACGLHNLFGPEHSDTLKVTSDPFKIGYGSGSVNGIKATDSIQVADVRIDVLFGVADYTSDDFSHFPFDGILGLSMGKSDTDKYAVKVKESKKLKSNVFSVYLSRSSTGPNTGEFTLGGTNPSKYTGDFSYTNISPAGNDSWAIPMDDIAFDGKSANVKGKLGYIDTGTSYIFGNRDEVKAFHALVPGSASDDGISWKVPCDTSKEISFTFSGKAWKVLPEDWISAKDGAGVCMSNIHGREVVSNGWLLGDVFLKNVYTVFDMDKPGVGFAAKAAPPPGPRATGSASASTSPGSKPSDKPAMGLGGHETSASGQSAESSTATPTSPSAGFHVFPALQVVIAAVLGTILFGA